MARKRLRGTNISRQSAKLTEVSHINGAKFEPLIPDMNINHGWKIHGDFVKDIASRDDALAKIGIRAKGAGFEIADQSIWDSTAARLEKLGIDTSIDSKNLMAISEGLIFKKNTEISPGSTSIVNGRPMITPAKFESMHSNPLDTISMMEVFDENQTQFKASVLYGEGREFTGYTQSIENRDKLISSLESRLGDRLEDVNPNILGGDQTEGATQLSKKITGRFTTEYTDIPNVGGSMDWSSQNPAASKGQAAIDNVMATNPEMRPYIHTGVIDDQSAANLQKLTDDFPVFNEMLHGPNGYVSPYGTIEDTFSQQGYDYKTGAAVKSSPVTPQAAPVTPQGTPVTPQAPPVSNPSANAASVSANNANKNIPLADEYDTGTTAERVAAGETLDEPPPVRNNSRRPRVGSVMDDARTSPSTDGPRVGRTAPTAPTASAPSVEDLVDLTDDQKRNVANVGNVSPPRATATAKIASNVDDVDMTARQAITQIGDQINNLRRTKKILSNDGARGVAQAITQGVKGSKNLRLAALGTAVGLGGYAASRFQHRNNNSDLRG